MTALVKSYVKALGTSGAAYEENGDYAVGIFASGWCKLLDNASRKLCHTKDNKKALACGKWLCHESCWKTSKKSIKTKKPIDVPCVGGIRLYAVPIIANGKSVGSINFGYQDPPRDEKHLKKLAALFKCNYEELKKASVDYQSRPRYVIEAAKDRLKISAEFIGLLIEHETTLLALSERVKELTLSSKLFAILEDYPRGSIERLLKRIVDIIPQAFQKSAKVCAQIIYNDAVFQTKNFKKTKHCIKDKVELKDHGKLKVAVFSLNRSSIRRDGSGFLKEEGAMIHNFLQSLGSMVLRNEGEKALLESNAKFRSVFENAADGIIAADVKTKKFIFANTMMCQITGYSLEELLCLGVSDIHPIKDFPYVERQFKRQLSGKISLAKNLPVLRKDGSIFFCDVNATVVKIAKRKCLVGVFRDITHRLEIESLLKTKIRHIRALSQVNQAIIYAKNEEDLLNKIELNADA